MNTKLKEIAKVWPEIQPIFSVPHNKKDYNKLVNLLDSLTDKVGNNENHPLTSLMETIGSLIEIYESQYINEIEGNPISVRSDCFRPCSTIKAFRTSIGFPSISLIYWDS